MVFKTNSPSQNTGWVSHLCHWVCDHSTMYEVQIQSARCISPQIPNDPWPSKTRRKQAIRTHVDTQPKLTMTNGSHQYNIHKDPKWIALIPSKTNRKHVVICVNQWIMNQYAFIIAVSVRNICKCSSSNFQQFISRIRWPPFWSNPNQTLPVTKFHF